MGYSPRIEYVSGKIQYTSTCTCRPTADALLRIPTESPNINERLLASEVELYSQVATNALLDTPSKLKEILEVQKKDKEIVQVMNYVCLTG